MKRAPLQTQVDVIRKRVDRLEECDPSPISLADHLRDYPGGLTRLAAATGYHYETIRRFALGLQQTKFPVDQARAIVEAFAKKSHDALGKAVTARWLHRAWTRERKEQEEKR